MSSNLPPWNISTGLTIVGFTPPVVTAPGRVRGHLLQSAQRPSRPSRGAMIRVSKITGAVQLAANDLLRQYVQDRLDGRIVRPDGKPAAAPDVKTWKGRRHGRRADRRWATAWSPEQIAGRLRVDFPDDESMRVSHEAIYQALYIQGRGALRRELTACLRTGRALRVPRARTKR